MNRNKHYQQVSDLIAEGGRYDFTNNSDSSYGETYSLASPEFLTWVIKVEDYIASNYSQTSGPHIMISSVDKSRFNGYYQYEFEPEFTKVKSAIQSCLNIKPTKKLAINSFIEIFQHPTIWITWIVSNIILFILGFYIAHLYIQY